MIIRSYAKINLSLKITGVREEDGYHLLELVNLPIDLFDTIEVQKVDSWSSFVTTDDPDLMQIRENICKKALDKMREKYGFKDQFRIMIHKDIPFAAGLGGGSSNAAAVMLAINKILKLNAKKEELEEIALSLGTDVPFFLDPKPSLVSGVGEKIEPIKVKKQYFCLLVKPRKGLDTQKVYQAADKFPRMRISTEDVIKGLAMGDDEIVERACGNDLMPAAESLCPDVGEVFAKLKKEGFYLSNMTGSGSTCFALSKDWKKCKEAAKRFEKAGYIVHLCKTMR
ncbi:MAG: 4-(cytidine 5'-diphospho)-2-C-methyl-D-erythritol kinase [Bacilli bacterium]|nr:4-(cytidine 5'-diphospho)-2-C-methyl-D-erythritol kinase [Bacilli bacterium]